MNLDSYTVIDVETPNQEIDSVCQIALIEVRDGQTVWKYDSLINPEKPFEDVCVNVHGIRPSDVENAPTLKEVWPRIAPHYADHIIVAHSASFDTSVIAASLLRCGIFLPRTRYVCTYKLALKLYGRKDKRASAQGRPVGSQPEGLSLDKLCRFFGVELLRHHNAKYDAEACLGILRCLLEKRPAQLDDICHYVLPCTDPSLRESCYMPLGGAFTSYCLTGRFCKGSKREVARLIASGGGIVHDTLHHSTDFLVVGGKGQPRGKCARAGELIKEGFPLRIIAEAELLEALHRSRGGALGQSQLFEGALP